MIQKTLDFLQKKIRTDVRYVLKGFFWSIAGHSVSTLSGIATSVVFANLLMPQTYGTFKYILSILPFLGISTLTRIDQSLSVSVAKGFEGDTVNAMKTKMKWGLLGSLAGLGLSLYYFLQGNNELGLLILILAIFVPFFNTPLIYNNFLTGKKKFKALSITNSATIVIYSILIIITVMLSKNVFVIVLSYFITNTLIRFIALGYVLKGFPPNKEREDKTIRYGKKLSVLEIVSIAAASIDNILVFNYLGAVELAAYAFIKKVPENIKTIPRFITALSTPKFSQQNIADPFVKKEVIRKTWFFHLGIVALALIYILAAPFIFEILFNPYKEYIFYSQIYALSFVFNFGGLFVNFVETDRRAKRVLSLHLTTSIFSILVIFLSLKFYGLLGLVAGYSLIRFFTSLMRYIFFKTAAR